MSFTLKGAVKVGSNATLVGRDKSGKIIATHTVVKPSTPAALRLIIDVPSKATGTGGALVLDGRDTGLLRAEVVDADGALCSTSAARITFAIASGAGTGRVIGTSNGDSTSHEQMASHSIAAFGGLARGLVQVAADCTSPHRLLMAGVDLDGGNRTAVPSGAACAALAAGAGIAVTASAPGLGSATVQIALSVDEGADGAFAVAEATAKEPLDYSYLRDFRG